MTDNSHVAAAPVLRTVPSRSASPFAMLLFGAIVIVGACRPASAGAPKGRAPASSRSMSGW